MSSAEGRLRLSSLETKRGKAEVVRTCRVGIVDILDKRC